MICPTVTLEGSTTHWPEDGQAMLAKSVLSGLLHRHSPGYAGFLATIQ